LTFSQIWLNPFIDDRHLGLKKNSSSSSSSSEEEEEETVDTHLHCDEQQKSSDFNMREMEVYYGARYPCD
jgi:hypothetical protein